MMVGALRSVQQGDIKGLTELHFFVWFGGGFFSGLAETRASQVSQIQPKVGG